MSLVDLGVPPAGLVAAGLASAAGASWSPPDAAPPPCARAAAKMSLVVFGVGWGLDDEGLAAAGVVSAGSAAAAADSAGSGAAVSSAGLPDFSARNCARISCVESFFLAIETGSRCQRIMSSERRNSFKIGFDPQPRNSASPVDSQILEDSIELRSCS